MKWLSLIGRDVVLGQSSDLVEWSTSIVQYIIVSWLSQLKYKWYV